MGCERGEGKTVNGSWDEIGINKAGLGRSAACRVCSVGFGGGGETKVNFVQVLGYMEWERVSGS